MTEDRGADPAAQRVPIPRPLGNGAEPTEETDAVSIPPPIPDGDEPISRGGPEPDEPPTDGSS